MYILYIFKYNTELQTTVYVSLVGENLRMLCMIVINLMYDINCYDISVCMIPINQYTLIDILIYSALSLCQVPITYHQNYDRYRHENYSRP